MGLFEKASLGFFMWKTLSWRGAAAAPVSEGPINNFPEVT